MRNIRNRRLMREFFEAEFVSRGFRPRLPHSGHLKLQKWSLDRERPDNPVAN
jgi:hypothetical protein